MLRCEIFIKDWKVYRMNKKVFSIVLMCTATLVFADSKVVFDSTVPAFSSIDIDSGVRAVVQCGTENKVVITNSKGKTPRVSVRKNGTLDIDVPQSLGLFGFGTPYQAVITINGTLSHAEVDSGGELTLPNCAMHTKTFEVDADSGARVLMTSTTQDIKVHADSGARVTVIGNGQNEVDIDLDKGARSSVCNVNTLSGSVEKGAQLYYTDTTLDDIHGSMGGRISYEKDCFKL